MTTVIDLAEAAGVSVIGGSDYRGGVTGWRQRAEWMDHPAIRGSFAEILQRSTGGLEEANLSSTLFLAFDPAAGKALWDLSAPVLVVVTTPEEASRQVRLGVPLQRLVCVVGDGYEQKDYEAGVSYFVRVSPNGDWQDQVVRMIEQRTRLLEQRVVAIYNQEGLLIELERLGVSSAKIETATRAYAGAEEAFARSQ